MILKLLLLILCLNIGFLCSFAQTNAEAKSFTRADTLSGSITPERAWWDLLHYDLNVAPNITDKTITGYVDIQFKASKNGDKMQVDLQQPLLIDSIFLNGKESLRFVRDSNMALVSFKKSIKQGSTHTVRVYYHGKPREAKNPPWDGGVTWTKDGLGNVFVSTSCQGLGASVWWPCKDHQQDEPNNGATISITTPDTLMDVSNGRLVSVLPNETLHTKTWKWEVKSPINNYSLSMNIGKYEHFSDTFYGEAGVLDLNFYPLSNHVKEAKEQFQQAKQMLRCFESWLGKYPFYEDGYKLIEVPYLGMEHQSAVTYGNKFKNGYLGRDLSGTGWGLKGDFIIIHESGHEWFGNNITSKDITDMWIHEGFTNYTETLFTEWQSGKKAAYEYNFGIRKRIANRYPIIGTYGVQNSGEAGTDMYYKASNMIHTIRNAINNDVTFKMMLRKLNEQFYHATITTMDIQYLMEQFAGFPLKPVFDQYLYLKIKEKDIKLDVTANEWKTKNINIGEADDITALAIEFNYYIKVKVLPTN